MKLNRVGYLLKEGLRGAFSHGFRSFASVTIIVACLIIMGSFSLVSLNVDSIIRDLEQQSEMLAFVDEVFTDDEAKQLEPIVASVPNVRSVKFVSRAEAMENFKAGFSNQSVFDDIGASDFRDRYVIYLNDITLMSETRTRLMEINGIADVNDYVELAEGFVTVRNVLSVVTVVMVVVLLVVSLFIIANTIKLATFTRREEIAIMKMVGATNGFIRLPFIIEGLILGLLGGGIAFFLEWMLYNTVTERIMTTAAGMLFSLIPFARDRKSVV